MPKVFSYYRFWMHWLAGIFLIVCGIPCQAGELHRIGVSVTDLGNPFFVRIAHGVEVAARRMIGPNVQVFVASSAYDLPRQAMQIDSFIKKKVDLIVITAADPVAIEPAVRKAQAAGIPVIAVDVRAAGADATITTDNVLVGTLACEYIAQQLKGHGKLVIINGPRVSATIDRVAGCLAKLKSYPSIQMLSADRDGGGSAEGGFAKMTDLLTLYPHIDAVFAINDPTAMGAEEAARQAGRSEFFIVGVDGAPKTRARMRDVGSLIIATLAQQPDLQAEKAVEYGYALIKKRPLPHAIALIPPQLVTKASAQEPSRWQE
ncbi:ABC transporter substrate-binding protein [Uliginosibacterium gangwonense]|uniref:ABC transporter substrate-binding protein n=1 Tax=Uliginosibacterium gangwonense TaxID=392736 RepID=UPI0003A1F7D7|nr:ABC transporter substrate-binding protein [Uliginosibacterium gangwonense]